MRVSLFTTLALAALAVPFFGLAQQAPGGPPQTPPPLKNVQVLKDLSRPELIAQMRVYAASLGVECNFCHTTGDFPSDDKREKVTARRMILMAQAIDHDNFDGRPEVTCYTCHRGDKRPVSQVPPAPAGGRGGGR